MDQTKENLPLLPTNSTKVIFLFPSPLGSRKASAAAVRNKGTGRGKTAERDSLPLASWSHGILSLPTQGMFRSPSTSPIPTVTSLKGTSRNGANGGWVKRYAITMQRLQDSRTLWHRAVGCPCLRPQGGWEACFHEGPGEAARGKLRPQLVIRSLVRV